MWEQRPRRHWLTTCFSTVCLLRRPEKVISLLTACIAFPPWCALRLWDLLNNIIRYVLYVFLSLSLSVCLSVCLCLSLCLCLCLSPSLSLLLLLLLLACGNAHTKSNNCQKRQFDFSTWRLRIEYLWRGRIFPLCKRNWRACVQH